ncbi:trigger factor [Candidatus Gracilibacteria bacterium]|nr:trigger factor [Candidatus Gracilibacteria bacterium]
MKVEVKKLPKSRVELTIEESSEKVASYRKNVLKDAAKNVQVKGFRKGATIPEDVLVKHIGEQSLAQMTIEKAIDAIYKDTLKSEKLMPVSQAQISEVVSESPLVVKVVVEVFPHIEMKDTYKKVKLTKEKLSISDDEVDAALKDIQTRFTHFHDTDAEYTAQMGDRVTIDTDGYDTEGKMLASTSMRDYPLVLGSNLLVPGFEEDMVGMKAGEKRELDVTFPADYHNADFAGKQTKFHVTAKKLERSHVPEFTEEFIEKLRGKKLDLAGFKELVREELLDVKTSNEQMKQEMVLIEELVKHCELEIGDALLSEQTNIVYREISENVVKDGIRMEDYLASLGLDEAGYKEKHVKEVALKRLQGELILSHLVEKESIEVSDDEMKDEIAKIMTRYESAEVLKRLEELYVPGNRYYEELKRRMRLRKCIDGFFA